MNTILYAGVEYRAPDGLVVVRDPKLSFPLGQCGTRVRDRDITQFIWHWNGGGGDAKATHRTLVRRKLSSQLFLGRNGAITQFVDINTVCAHAGTPTNGRSIGVEAQCPGHTPGRAGWAYLEETIHETEVRVAQWTDEMIVAAIALRRWLAEIVPTLGPIHVDPRTTKIDITERNRWRGDLAHYQINGKKKDPGTHTMARLAAAAHESTMPVDIREAQRLLGVVADGRVGPATRRAVTAFQASHGLVQDGVLGPVTMAALRAVASVP